MKTFTFEPKVARILSARLEEATHAIARIADRVQRTDLERDARYAGTLLAAANGAARVLAESPDAARLSAAAATYIEKLERAEQAVITVYMRSTGKDPEAPSEG
jgi:hypothetical protein